MVIKNPIDKMEEECGVFGVYSTSHKAADLCYLGLYALQHRGQESAGIAVSNGREINIYKDMGLVPEVFDEEILQSLQGNMGIGHVRYSTAGESKISNAQPLVIQCFRGNIALAHNGNLVNAKEIKERLIKEGAVFQTTTDSEVIVNLIARSKEKDMEAAIVDACQQIKGAFSLVIMTEGKIYGVRDSHGIRPLCLGELDDGFAISSESCGISSVGGRFIRDVKPGEMVIIGQEGIKERMWAEGCRKGMCVFEYIYFARPDSDMEGVNVHTARKNLGKILAREAPVEADLVIGVPDSGTSPALGFSEISGIPFGEGMIKNRYVGRTFIQPKQEIRELSVRIKLNPINNVLRGKRIVMVDDSIVRGTTSGRIVKMLKDAGAKEVHVRISSPPVKYPCYFGIDTPEREFLIAANHDVEEICKFIGADSLAYVSMEGMLEAVGMQEQELCVGCFNGNYVEAVPGQWEEGKKDG